MCVCVTQAKHDKDDVCLIDTSGRMQDNEKLMRSLAKLVHNNNPDLVCVCVCVCAYVCVCVCMYVCVYCVLNVNVVFS